MATEWICRAIRDGAVEGVHAPALTLKDTLASSPLGFHVFTHLLSQHSSAIAAAKSQSRGLVLVSLSRSPSFYLRSLTALTKVRVLDCYSDPLGWRARCGCGGPGSYEGVATVCGNVNDLDGVLSSIVSLGREFVGNGSDRFSVAIDSVDKMLRYTSLSSVSAVISSLRSCDQVSSIFWFCHADLCEERATLALEYNSSMVASIEPLTQFADGQRSNTENRSLRDQNSTKGKLHLRCKHRNGRVRVMFEEIHIGQSGINFVPTSSEDRLINQGLVPKVQFNLQLSEKELKDRANVVLPFEHQGNGKPVQIYDGRKSLTDSKYEVLPAQNGNSNIDKESGKGEIIYFRDSEDDMPDSDEDPDDDLDI